jgi:hypothetical protein
MIANSLSWGHKLPDPPKAMIRKSSPRPLDGFGLLRTEDRVVSIYWEAKFDRQYQAIQFADRLAEHQIESLSRISEIGKASQEIHVLSLLILGVGTGRGADLFAFDFDSVIGWMNSGRRSFLKKELESLRDAGMSLHSYKGRFDFPGQLLSHIIDDARVRAVLGVRR